MSLISPVPEDMSQAWIRDACVDRFIFIRMSNVRYRNLFPVTVTSLLREAARLCRWPRSHAGGKIEHGRASRPRSTRLQLDRRIRAITATERFRQRDLLTQHLSAERK